jgi:hypothetical protein
LDSRFDVTTPTTDRTLLSIGELRAAVGVTDQTRDVELKALGFRVADRITRACQLRADGATVPTLRKERITETFRQTRVTSDPRRHYSSELVLSRRPIVAVTSVTEDGTALTSADYEIFASKGALRRLTSATATFWYAMTTVIVYDSGWDIVPSDLKFAAEQLARAYWFQNSRDPALRQISVPGVIEKQFWVGASGDPDIPQNVMDMLSPYMNPAIG